jgi:2Fe-2S ferredoxin
METMVGELMVSTSEGVEAITDAQYGESLMEILRENLFDVPAVCGGAGTCGTCHIRVSGRWTALLKKPDDYEVATLKRRKGYVAGESRLACQIPFTEALAGMEFKLIGR